jgi:hypothetical protein
VLGRIGLDVTAAIPAPYNGRFPYTGRAGAGINQAELERRWRRLLPMAISEMPLEIPLPRITRFGWSIARIRACACGENTNTACAWRTDKVSAA